MKTTDMPTAAMKVSLDEIVAMTGESRNLVYDAIKAGHLETFLVGRRRFAKPEAVRKWVDFLASESAAGRPVTYRARTHASHAEPAPRAPSSGLTKREAFAMAAMQGLYAGYYAHRNGIQAVRDVAIRLSIDEADMIARCAVDGADALLAELAK